MKWLGASSLVSSSSVHPEYEIDEKLLQTHRLDSLTLLFFTLLLTMTVLTVWFFKHHRVRFLHETGLAIFYGLVLGAAIRYCFRTDDSTYLRVKPVSRFEMANVSLHGIPDFVLLEAASMNSQSARAQMFNQTLSFAFKGEVKDVTGSDIDHEIIFNPEIFFNILLPPIIFNAGYSMKRRAFFMNIGSILVFAFMGTAISALSVGAILYAVTKLVPSLGQFFTGVDCLHFGALISATDPVTVLAIFNDLNVDVNLYALVFGESILNDAIAIVMTKTLEDYQKQSIEGSDGSSTLLLLHSFLDFVSTFGFSFLVGSLIGLATALLTKFTYIKHFPELEASLFILMSYTAFLIAEVLDLTGIVSVLFCGICQAHYTSNNLSETSKISTKRFFHLLSFLAENFIFGYIGITMFTFKKHNFNLIFIAAAIIAIIVGRVANIYPLTCVLNLGRKKPIPFSFAHLLCFAGLRGALAFALAIRNTMTEARKMMLSTTMIIVIASVVVCGGSTMSLISFLNIPLASNGNQNERRSPSHGYVQFGHPDNASNSLSVEERRRQKSWIANLWSGFDQRYMKPLFTHSFPSLMETLPPFLMPLARILTSKEQMNEHPGLLSTSPTAPAALHRAISAEEPSQQEERPSFYRDEQTPTV